MFDDIKGFDIQDPTELLLYVDESLLDGRIELHNWQLKLHKDFAKSSDDKSPFQACVRTCNGAGKDRIIIAPCATWLCMRYPNTVCVVTSASGTQLDRQTNTYIKQICEAVNKKFGQEIWKINYRHYENVVTKSTIELFVTDESGRAEGWHPVVPNGHLAIFTSEAKSIPEEIFHALARCTGFTKRVDCSTPGLPLGHFFDRCTTAASTYRPATGTEDHKTNGWKQYLITAYDCPHLSTEYIEQCKTMYGGEDSALFKSMVLAEFGSTDDMVVIPYHYIWKAIYKPTIQHLPETFNHAGLDLSAGGDETTLAIRNGNKLLNIFGWRYDDTSATINYLERLFKENGLQNSNSYIFGDAGGLGKPILDQLRSKGWHNIRYVLNQSKPRDARVYANRGAELWFNFRSLIERGEIMLPDDRRLRTQLSSRYYKQTEGNKIQLESKLQARAKGHPSPDRADATILCFSNYKSKLGDEPLEEDKLPLPKRKVADNAVGDFTLKEYAKAKSGGDDIYSKYYGSRKSSDLASDVLREQIDQYNKMIKDRRQKLEQEKELTTT